MVSCESQLSPALCVALRFVLTWVCMRESWGQMGGWGEWHALGF